jgi:hypothetical protein
MTNKSPITLIYGRAIRAAGWNDISFATVFTMEGYAAKHGSDVAASVARALSNGHELAGSIYTGATLYSNRAEGARANREARAIVAAAVTLATGDLAEIEGREYMVHLVRGNEAGPVNSDPFKFLPV